MQPLVAIAPTTRHRVLQSDPGHDAVTIRDHLPDVQLMEGAGSDRLEERTQAGAPTQRPVVRWSAGTLGVVVLPVRLPADVLGNHREHGVDVAGTERGVYRGDGLGVGLRAV